jgi:hypothetical protein
LGVLIFPVRSCVSNSGAKDIASSSLLSASASSRFKHGIQENLGADGLSCSDVMYSINKRIIIFFDPHFLEIVEGNWHKGIQITVQGVIYIREADVGDVNLRFFDHPFLSVRMSKFRGSELDNRH